MISWRDDFGCWWPDYDHKPEACFRRVMQCIADMDPAVEACRAHRVAVQAGGHAGLWPRRLAQKFQAVFTFEPDLALFSCLMKNCGGAANVYAQGKALGAFEGEVMLRPAVSAGSWRVDPAGTVPAAVTTIDFLHLAACDAIFLDVEGYEVEVLKGAAATIARFRPVIMVEELPRSQEAIIRHMAGLGYRLLAKVHEDRIYVPA